MLYGQNSEDAFVIAKFEGQKEGKFLDIGAYHVTHFSNTRCLVEMGFKGVLVEPAPQNYKAIAEHYAGNENIEVLNFAVGEPAGEITFYESNGDAVGTTSIEHRDKWGAAGVKYTPITVKQVGVIEFFEKYGHGVDMLSIDTESTNLSVFRNVPDWVWDEIKMLIIEHDGGHEEIEQKLTPFGFSVLHINAENIILSK